MIRKYSILFIVLLLNAAFVLSELHAQIITDGTLGPAASISGPDYQIIADLGKQAGNNLFHSFSEFSISAGESAVFTGPNSVENIISRVTGRNESRIDGFLRSQIPGANFFLLNPSGVIFGPHASLDMSGSFHVSTADYLRLGEDGRFDAVHPGNDVLKTASPSAFGFLGEKPGSITFQGSGSKAAEDYWGMNGISVPQGETLSVIGGDIHIGDGLLLDSYPVGSHLRASGGQVNMASVASRGEVPADAEPDISAFEEHGEISLTGGSVIDVSSNKSGNICIRGGKFVVSEESSVTSMTFNEDGGGIDIRMSRDSDISNGGKIITTTFGTGKGGDISFSADNMNIRDDGQIFAISGTVSSGSIIGGEGDGGNIRLKTNQLEITGEKSFVSSATLDVGKAGDISITGDIVKITDDGRITADNGIRDPAQEKISFIGGEGRGGDITFEVNRLEMERGSISSNTFGTGAGGNIQILEAEFVYIAGSGTEDVEYPENMFYGIGSQAWGTGDGGHITIETDTLNLVKDATINGQNYGSGQGGDIELNANRVEIHQGGTITTSTRGAGKAGAVSITADKSVNLSGSGTKLDKSRIYTATHSGGPGGNLTISTNSLTIGKDGEIFAKTLGDDTYDGNTLKDGPGGDIELNAERLELRHGGLITAGSESEGDAGNIAIHASDSVALDNASVKTSTEQSDGGDITINADKLLHLSGSTVTTSVKGGKGNGGNITIDPEFVILNNTQVIANAHGGDGGNIHITSEQFVRSSDSLVDASSTLGIDGQIYIESPEADVTGAITVLPGNYLDAARWLKTPCSARTGEDVSQFVITPRDALPTRADDWLASPPPIFDNTELLEIKENTIREHLIRGEKFHSKGDFENAVRTWEEAIPLLETEGLPYLHTLAYLANAYQALGHHRKALSAFSQALPVFKKSDDPYRKALFFSTLGDIHLSLGEKEDAKANLKKGLDAARASGIPQIQAVALNNMGNLLVEEDEHGAMTAYQESLGITEASDISPKLKSKVLLNIARVMLRSVTYQEEDVVSLLDKTLSHIRTLPDSHGKASALISLSLLAREVRSKREPRDNSRTESRLKDIAFRSLDEAKGLAENLQDIRIASYAYGYLGQLQEEAAHYPQGIKLTRKAAFLAQQRHCPEISYLWQWQTGRLFKAQGDIEKAIRAYCNATAMLNPILREFHKGYRGKKETLYGQVKPVYIGFADLILKYAESPNFKAVSCNLKPAGSKSEDLQLTPHTLQLKAAMDIMELLKTAELQDFYQDECVTAMKKKAVRLDIAPPHTAILYPIPLPDRLALLLTMPDGIKHFTAPVDSQTLRKTAHRFGTLLHKPANQRFKYHAKHLYDWLIHPFEADLISQNITTLIVVPDGALRTIPFSALHDGDHFLIEKYAIATVPAVTLTDSGPIDLENAQVLLNGLSEAKDGFDPLPNVPAELRNVRQTMGGRILQDQDYILANLTSELRNLEYSVIHIATHGVFGGTPEETFLLTYDDKLTMDQLEEFVSLGRFRNKKVELLTLSACQTALGDERAALGLAGVALKAGARSAVATLWTVNDKATSLLISEFYRQLKMPGISKAKALQNAQKKFVDQPRYRHPYYWSPFLLIGNWL